MKTIILDGVEYELVPVAKKDAGGWVTWNGGACPIPEWTMVDVRYRDGEEALGVAACKNVSGTPRDAGPAFWHHDGQFNDIVAYRLSEEQ